MRRCCHHRDKAEDEIMPSLAQVFLLCLILGALTAFTLIIL